VATGLWPLPAERPVRAVVHGRLDRPDYTVEKVYLESYPGHFVTGNLYRPKGTTGHVPAVLSPHGHFAAGRFHDHGRNEVRKQIVEGAERFEVGGRHPIQARCVQLARMGCIVFQYDMVGYADSRQIPPEIAHGFSRARPEFETPRDWGFYSTQAELRMQNIMGLQTYNSLCALDWIASLPEVDPARIGVTGSSGGGTQTMILCAIDPRPAVSFPAVMVSTSMQGGCTCENACCLRVGTGNIEFAALFAPKPLGMTAADDWTREIATKGLPELKQLYGLLGVEDRVMARPLLHFPHNYNSVSRAVMYSWMNKHLGLGHEEPVVEEDYQPLAQEDMSVWNSEHPQPPGGAEHERALLRAITEQSDRQLAAVRPTDPASLAKFREVVGGALDVIIGRQLPPPGSIERTKVQKRDRGDHFQFHDLVRFSSAGEALPTLFLLPKKWLGDVVIWVDGQGKQGLFNGMGKPCPEARQLLDAGVALASADLVYQGEFLADGEPLPQLRTVENSRDYAGFTFGYNPTLFAQRVHDILSLVSFVRNDEHAPRRVHLVGVRGAGPWVVAARALMGDEIDLTAVDTSGFRFVKLASWRDENFLPGAVKYGDLPAMLALCAPHRLWIAGESPNAPDFALPTAAYHVHDAQGNMTFARGESAAVLEDAVAWLLERSERLQ
jgi:dienelactone hydrolase